MLKMEIGEKEEVVVYVIRYFVVLLLVIDKVIKEWGVLYTFIKEIELYF